MNYNYLYSKAVTTNYFSKAVTTSLLSDFFEKLILYTRNCGKGLSNTVNSPYMLFDGIQSNKCDDIIQGIKKIRNITYLKENVLRLSSK